MAGITKVLCKNPDVSCRPEKPEGAILFNPVEDKIELLNMTGLTIWELVDNNTIGDISEGLIEIFGDVSREELEKDVIEFIDNLVEKGFVNECGKTE